MYSKVLYSNFSNSFTNVTKVNLLNLFRGFVYQEIVTYIQIQYTYIYMYTPVKEILSGRKLLFFYR